MRQFQLRPYQKAASDAVFEAFKESPTTLVVKPTGTGKTVLFADVIRRMHPQRSVVLAHRSELIWQARQKIESTTGLSCDIEMAHIHADGNMFQKSDVIVSTVQTQISGMEGKGRMTRFDPMSFGLLIIDEAHHAISPSYRKIIDYYRQNPDLRVLGVTATPDRTDEAALGQVFGNVAFDYEILDAIHDGWLVPIDQQMVCVEGLDFSSVRTTAGDLNGADLAAVMEAEKNMQGVAGSAIEIIGSRRAIVFTASVKQAETIAQIFNRHRGGMASWVCGKTNPEERQKILSDFSKGETQVVANCGVLTEGFDDAGVEVIIMARPTKSRSLYSQMVGRATRPLPGLVDGPETSDERKSAIATSAKPSMLVVDFVGNSGRHKLMTSADILGGKVSDEIKELAVRMVKKKGAMRMSDALDEAAEQLKREAAEELRRQEAARKAGLVAKVKYSSQKISPFDVLQIQPVTARGWDRGGSLSEKQRGLLSRAGIDPESVPFSQAKQLVGAICERFSKKLCTFKQAKLLQKHGYETNVTMQEAGKLIDALAKNGWRKPA